MDMTLGSEGAEVAIELPLRVPAREYKVDSTTKIPVGPWKRDTLVSPKELLGLYIFVPVRSLGVKSQGRLLWIPICLMTRAIVMHCCLRCFSPS